MRRTLAIVGLLLATLLSVSTARAEVKHVIVMISDGWGQSQIDATAAWNGYRPLYETEAGWTRFGLSNYMYHEGTENPPNGDPGFVGIHGYDPTAAWADWSYMQNWATDSAAAATSMSCGEKAFIGSIGYRWDHTVMIHLMESAETLGLATGTVTSVLISGATPAAFRAHNESRDHFVLIANEIVYQSGLTVWMGGGHPNYDDDGLWDPGDPGIPADWKYVGGLETWNDLLAGVNGWTLIDAKAQFEALADGTLVLDRVVGVIPAAGTLQYDRAGRPGYNDPEPPYTVPFITTVPTLATMTRGALNVLAQNPAGFVCLIEGGAIDWAGHDRVLGRLIEEQNDFDAAVEAVVDWVETNSDWDESLLVVTGDHETGFLWGAGVNPDDPVTWFSPVQDHGPCAMPGFTFYSAPGDDWQNPTRGAGHTNQIIPFYFKGDDGGLFADCADETDPHWGALGGYDGRYLDNTELAQTLFSRITTNVAVEDGTPRPGRVGPTLDQNTPNPFNPTTVITFGLPAVERVRLTVHDLRGRLVRTLVEDVREGRQTVTWDGRDQDGRPVASGSYLCRLRSETGTIFRTMTLLR